MLGRCKQVYNNHPHFFLWGWFIFIAVLCGIPGRDIPHISFLELLSADKFIHAFLFMVLQVFALHAYAPAPHAARTKVVLFAAVVAYGGFLELMQQWVFTERSADLYDFIANSFGALLGLLFAAGRKYNGASRNQD